MYSEFSDQHELLQISSKLDVRVLLHGLLTLTPGISNASLHLRRGLFELVPVLHVAANRSLQYFPPGVWPTHRCW